MSDQTDDTQDLSPDDGWELVWKELELVGIVQGQPGPADAGANAARAIRSLQQSDFTMMQIGSIGLLVQAAIRAAKLNIRLQ
ncbi:MAG: hypothetical protein AB7K24_23465 [Gemmataceae bacterium]